MPLGYFSLAICANLYSVLRSKAHIVANFLQYEISMRSASPLVKAAVLMTSTQNVSNRYRALYRFRAYHSIVKSLLCQISAYPETRNNWNGPTNASHIFIFHPYLDIRLHCSILWGRILHRKMFFQEWSISVLHALTWTTRNRPTIKVTKLSTMHLNVIINRWLHNKSDAWGLLVVHCLLFSTSTVHERRVCSGPLKFHPSLPSPFTVKVHTFLKPCVYSWEPRAESGHVHF